MKSIIHKFSSWFLQLIGFLAMFGAAADAPASEFQSVPPDPKVFIAAYNALEDGRWMEAWRGFQKVGSLRVGDLDLFLRSNRGARVSTPRRTLAVADSLARVGREDDALALLDSMIETRPASSLPYALKAMVLLKTNRLDEARATLVVAPDTAHINLLRAYAELRRKNYTEARRLLETNWTQLESCFLACNTSGFLCVIEGRLGDALKDFERVLELNPDFTPARQNIEFTSLMRARQVFGHSQTDLAADAAKGLLGASGSFNLGAYYDKQHGFMMDFRAKVDLQTSQWLSRKGLFARSDATLEDLNEKGTPDLSAVFGARSDSPSNCVGYQTQADPQLTCPMLIWN